MRPSRRSDPYWMLLPTLLLLFVFFFFPLGVLIRHSFFSWDLLTPPRYVGFGNYRSLVRTGELWHTFGTTLSISGAVVLGSMSAGLALALLLDRPGRWAAFVRSAVFSAYVVSWVSVGLLFLWLLDADSGIFAALFRFMAHGRGPGFLADPALAPWAVAAVTIWKITGYALVIFLAGLQDVPQSILEAAELDGASPVRRFQSVTWPLLRPTTLFVATTSLIASFQLFDVVRVMTQGGPVRSTTVFVYAIYEQLFLDLRVGRASAEAVVFFAILLLLTALQWLLFRGQESA
ncbi:MAG TPA: sugar ABC transporter permease [Polyangiaceae bacterium]|nr:sugar ABC transporter permease [Polyangiaceae bacterium]